MNKMIILKDSEINRERWSSFLLGNMFSTPFQSTEYYNFINSVPGQYASAFAIEAEDKLQALCVVTFQKENGIKGYFSRRAIIYGGPLIAEGENGEVALKILLTTINRHLINKVIYGEIRNFVDNSIYRECFSQLGWNYQPHLNVQINIKGKSIEGILGEMKYNRRREISLSFKAGASINEATSVEEIHALYRILKNLYNERVKSPLPAFEFFHMLFLSAVGKVFLVKHNNNVIGGSFCIHSAGLSVNTIYYCGLREYNKKIFPTHLAIMAAIQFGIDNNLQIVDLMGAGKPGIEYGVRNYKIEFGGELVEHGRYIKIYNSILFRLGSIGLELLNKIKK
jgi:serine/alanine adding enzyme